MILARTELAAIDALRASGEEPERILEFIDSIVTKGIDTGRFDMCHVETDPEAALRLAEALLGTNRYPAFARAMRILETVTPYVEDRSDGMLLFTLSTMRACSAADPLMQRAAPSPGSEKTKGTSAFFICSAFFAQARDALTRPANGFCAPMSRVPMIPSSFTPSSSWRHASRLSASFSPARSGRTETLTIRRLELRSAPFAWPASSSIPTGTQTP